MWEPGWYVGSRRINWHTAIAGKPAPTFERCCLKDKGPNKKPG